MTAAGRAATSSLVLTLAIAGGATGAARAETPAVETAAAAASTGTGTVSGRITVPSGATLPRSILIEVLGVPADGGSSLGWGNPRLTAHVEGDGTWQLDDVPAGRYVVKVLPWTHAWATQYVSRTAGVGSQIRDEARQVDVRAGQTVSGLSIRLVRNGTISGRVHVPVGVDATTVLVDAHVWQPDLYLPGGGKWEWVGYVSRHATATDGAYTVTHLPPGRYRVRFWSLDPQLGSVWAGGTETAESAADVVVREGMDTVLDAALPIGTPVPPRPEVPDLPEVPLLPEVPQQPQARVRMLGKPVVTGKAKVGRTLKASRGRWNPSKVTVKFRWQTKRGSKAVNVRGATKAKLRLTKKFRGKKVRVKVTVSAPGYGTVSRVTRWRKVA